MSMSTEPVQIETVQSAADPTADVARSASESPKFLQRLLRRPIAVLCLAYLAAITGIAIIAPIALPEVAGQNAGDLLAVRQLPTPQHLLGTDTLGRDVLERLLVGTRITMIGVFEALVVVLALGVPLGLAAGFFGGWIDTVIGWLADLSFSMPNILMILVVLTVYPQNMTAAMVTLGFIAAPGLMRIVRSETISVREELYIAAAKVSGLSNPYIIARHVLPRIAGAVIVQASLLAAAALLVQTGLAFLDLVVPAPAPSWGGMVADGVRAMVLQPWLIWPPGIAIALTILAFGLLADVVRDTTSEGWSTPLQRSTSRARRRTPMKVSSPSPRPLEPVAKPAAKPVIEPAADALLSIEGLRVSFGSATSARTVLDDVSLEVRPGETIGLVGESGCGKTATAMSILGLLPGTGRIEAGTIWFNGRDLAALPERELRGIRGKEIGLISQEPMISLNPAFRIGRQLAEAVRKHHGVTFREAHSRAIALLRRVHLPDPETVARRYPHELSGGMAQRVAIARALAGEPKLLIADEPTTALDVTVQAEILDLLREIQREHGMAVLLVTHDWGVVADICDRAVIMYAGQVVECAELLPMFQQPLHPYTEALLAANPQNATGTEMLPAIPGSVPPPGQWPLGCHFHTRCRYATDACREASIQLEQPANGRLTRCIHHDQLAVNPEGAADR